MLSSAGKIVKVSCLGLWFGVHLAFPQHNLSFEFSTGVPYNVPLPLTIHQSGWSDISLTAHYSSEPFVVPISWDWRIGYWSQDVGWEFEAIHHKIILDNRPGEVQWFAITHGLNVVVVNRAWIRSGFVFRAGAGISISHPETIVRGKSLPEDRGLFGLGYYLSGPALHIAVGKRIFLTEEVLLSIEAKFFASFSSVPIQDGTAEVFHAAFQAGIGFGYAFAL